VTCVDRSCGTVVVTVVAWSRRGLLLLLLLLLLLGLLAGRVVGRRVVFVPCRVVSCRGVVPSWRGRDRGRASRGGRDPIPGAKRSGGRGGDAESGGP
jgi:hypothetical protein